MLTVLSPAKKLDETSPLVTDEATQPVLRADTLELMRSTRELSTGELKGLMHISDALATLNHKRFQDFETPFTALNSRPAVQMFAGDVYVGLDAKTLSADDLHWAHGRLRILSGLYGVLRPLDLMQAYRLEMGTRLATARGRDLYAFWGERIAAELSDDLAEHADQTLLNLASNEYFKAVTKKRLPGAVITPVFKDRRDGKSRVISFFAKRARGAMARFVVQERVEQAEGVQAFTGMGYRFQPADSTATRWVFERQQPPPAGAR